jgi:hypothetical protein
MFPDVAVATEGGSMAAGEPKMTEMSKPAEILYRALLDELRFAKQQQWTVTNYTLLLMGSVYGLARLTTKSPTFYERVAWCAVVAVVVVIGLLVLVDLEGHVRFTRARQSEIEKTFEPEDRNLVRGKRRMPRWLIFAVLCVVVTAAGILAAYAIWQLP